MSLVQLRGLQKTYKTGEVEVEALKGVDLDKPTVERILRSGDLSGLTLPPETPGRQLVSYRQLNTGSAP